MEQGYKNVSTEQFKNTGDMFAEILIIGISKQLKQGLKREYIENTEQISLLRGKIDVAESIKKNSLFKRQLVCTYDEYSINSYMNRILRTTMEILVKSDISEKRKKSLRMILSYFSDVEMLDPYNINWHQHYDKNNRTYHMMISVCLLVIKGLLQTTSDGKTRLMDFLDEQHMHRLYEKFILEYYRKEYPRVKVTASQIPWMIDDELNDDLLPIMQTDVMLEYGNNTLIIDAKYYSKNLQENYENYSIHSGNLYQIFTYVKNKVASIDNPNAKVSGLILYAKTKDELQPSGDFVMGGNRIGVSNLNLDCNFDEIRAQLDSIIRDFLCVDN